VTDGFEPFEYGRFFRTIRPGARFHLLYSGAADTDLAAIDDAAARPRIASADGREAIHRWREALTARYGVPAECAVPAFGAHGAVHLVLTSLATLLPRGATVAVEWPGYGIFESAAKLAGREVVRVARRAEDAWGLDLDAAERAFAAGAKVLCVTDLHNPTGAALDAATLDALRDLARRHDAWIVVNEIYRDFLPGRVATAYRPGGRVIALSSLTKCYGLGGLRAGWVFADPEILDRAADVADIVHGSHPTATLDLAAHALVHGDAILDRTRGAAAAGRPLMDEWIAATPGVSWVPPAAGLTGLVRIDGVSDSVRLAARLREELDLQVVPGAHFGAEGHLRLSFGRPPADVAAALCVLGMGLGALRD
jgi:aspartate/methionine/tyrosine aminotransferase